jgi:hypothetical protein
MPEEAQDGRESANNATPPKKRPTTNEIVCPSGFAGTIRRMTIRELDALSSRKANRAGTSLDLMFSQTWIGTSELGPYRPPFVEFPEGSKGASVDWSKVFLGDRTHVMMELRRFVLGDEFGFDVTCPAALCRRRIEWQVDLSKLERKDMTEEVRAHLVEHGNEFVRTLPYSGKKVSFKMLTGADERRVVAATKDNPDALLSSTMLVRIVGVEGARTPSERRAFVENMDLEDATWIQQEWEAVDSGVSTDVEIECPHCGKITRIELPFDADFFSPRSCPKKKISGS